jgi:ubiquinone/menaquinone biosynthesis C-methylase UbiE
MRALRMKQDAVSEKYFKHADTGRFRWQTENRLVAEMEKAVLGRLDLRSARTVLEIGCGEGANIRNLKHQVPVFIGLDLYPEKLQFASSRADHARFVCGDALALPFHDDYFDFVFCRDVLHHLSDKTAMIREMIRVLRPGSPFAILEANGSNFVWNMFGTLVKAERHLKENTAQEFERLLAQESLRKILKAETGFLYMPLFLRLLAHYKFGFEGFGNSPVALFLSRISERYLKKYCKRGSWAYIIISGVKAYA